MEKTKISLSSEDLTKIIFQEQEIMVKTYIPSMNRNVLSGIYIEALYDKDTTPEEGFFYAENSLILGVLEYCTSIDPYDVSMDLDKIISSGLWDVIKDKIKNYNSLHDDIDHMVYRIDKSKALEKSLGSVIELLIQKAESGLKNMNELDSEKLGELIDRFKTEATHLDTVLSVPPAVELEKKPRKKRVSKKETLI